MDIHRIVDPRTERKLGKKVLAAISEMGQTHRDNVERFTIVKRQLARAVAEYKKYTGSDTLLHPIANYGYHV